MNARLVRLKPGAEKLQIMMLPGSLVLVEGRLAGQLVAEGYAEYAVADSAEIEVYLSERAVLRPAETREGR